MQEFQKLKNQFEVNEADVTNGFFGYTNYDAVKYFDSIEINATKQKEHQTPEMFYSLFQYVIQIDHFKNVTSPY